jgi:hypothetical protein
MTPRAELLIWKLALAGENRIARKSSPTCGKNMLVSEQASSTPTRHGTQDISMILATVGLM